MVTETNTTNFIPRPREVRFYRPKKDGAGCAAAIQLSYKQDNKYEPWMMFLTVAPQTGTDENDNASFDWKEKSIKVKLGDNDIGEMLAVLQGRQNQVGFKGSLFHETPGGGNKILQLSVADNGGYYLQVSGQDKDKKPMGRFSLVLSNGDASILQTLLERAVILMYNWV